MATTGTGAAGVCTPGAQEACYSGDPNTLGVGLCQAGSRTCAADGSAWGSCEGEVLPVVESCATGGIDDDCNGVADDSCICDPGTMAPCYSGPAGTEGVAACQGGTAECAADGKSYGTCEGEVVPSPQSCDVPVLDDDCDGSASTGCCTSGSWTLSLLDSMVSWATPRIRVDDVGTLHALFYSSFNNQMYVGQKPRGGSWTAESGSPLAIQPSMTFGPEGRPHLMYTYGSSFYRRRTGPNNSWVETAGPSLHPRALAIDSLGGAHAALRDEFSSELSVFRHNNGSWSQQLLDPQAWGSWFHVEELLAGNDGRVHLAYTKVPCAGCTDSRLQYAVSDANGWSAPVELAQITGGRMGMSTDEQGHPWVAFVNATGSLEVRGDAGWSVSAVCGNTVCGVDSTDEIAILRHGGVLHVVLLGGQGLRYVRYNGTFQSEPIESFNNPVGYPSMTIDRAGGLHIAYLTQSALWHGYRCP